MSLCNSSQSFAQTANQAASGTPISSQANYVDDPSQPPTTLEEVYHGPSITVNVAARQLKLFEDNQLVKTYSIAVGSPGYRTPLGKRSMKQIVWNAWWLPPPDSAWAKDAKPTPPGKGNPLGSIKMDLGEAILFHGTNKPNSIGKAASHGCMRMHTEDARELARWIQERITDQNTPEIFAKYDVNKGRSFYVKLPTQVPVDIIYEAIEVSDNTLFVYQDIYGKVGAKKLDLIRDKLAAAGHNVEEFDWNFIKEQLKANKSDLNFLIHELLVKNRQSDSFASQPVVNGQI